MQTRTASTELAEFVTNANTLFQQKIVPAAGSITDFLNSTISSSAALPGLIGNKILAAWPEIASSAATKYTTLAVIPTLGVLELVAHVLEKQDVKAAKYFRERFHNINAGASAAYFYLTGTIAFYLAGAEALDNIGDGQINISNLAYGMAFVLPSLVIGATLTGLEATKSKWSISEAKSNAASTSINADAEANAQQDNHSLGRTALIKAAKLSHGSINFLTTAGAANTLIAPLFAEFGFDETGSVNQYKRGLVFLTATIVAAVITLANLNKKAANLIPTIIGALCSATFLYNLMNADSREALGETGTNVMLTSIMLLCFASAMSGLISHLVKANAEPDHDTNYLLEEPDLENYHRRLTTINIESEDEDTTPLLTPAMTL